MNFYEKFLRHEVNREDIFSYVEEWHKDPKGKSLTDFLGMTLAQYHLFLMEPKKADELRNKKYENTGSFVSRIQNITDRT
jgi:hypothetical protein